MLSSKHDDTSVSNYIEKNAELYLNWQDSTLGTSNLPVLSEEAKLDHSSSLQEREFGQCWPRQKPDYFINHIKSNKYNWLKKRTSGKFGLVIVPYIFD